jgi:hypothetical protein
VARLTANGDGPYEVAVSGADATRLRAESGIADASPSPADIRRWPEATDAAWLRGVLT